MRSTLKGKNLLLGSKFFPLRVDLYHEGRKNTNRKVTFLEVYHSTNDKSRKIRAYLMIVLIYRSPGRSPGTAIELPPASVSALAAALAKSLTLKFFM